MKFSNFHIIICSALTLSPLAESISNGWQNTKLKCWHRQHCWPMSWPGWWIMFRLLPLFKRQSSSICLIELHILPKNISDEQQLRKTWLAKHITTYRIYHKTSYLSHSPHSHTPSLRTVNHVKFYSWKNFCIVFYSLSFTLCSRECISRRCWRIEAAQKKKPRS